MNATRSQGKSGGNKIDECGQWLNRESMSAMFDIHSTRRDHVMNSSVQLCTHAQSRTCTFLSLPLPPLALHALLNRTDGSDLAITHRIAWLICVLLQVQRCQAGAAGLPWLPLRPLILWLVSSLPALAHLAHSAASKLLFPALFPFLSVYFGSKSAPITGKM